ncbi:hypothetical protein KKG71_02685 [Patescibacteria group bacterium]|nr:hypothetical protein [Patescibacteria group bacterium]
MFENIWWWVIIIALAFTTFLIMLNGFLRGKWKHHTDAVLSAALLALLVLSVILFGWFIALCHLIGLFVFGALIYSVAARIAARLLRH